MIRTGFALLIGIIVFLGMGYGLVQNELNNMDRAERLLANGIVTRAVIDGATITQDRVFMIPLGEHGEMTYHFRPAGSADEQATRSVMVESIQALSADGYTPPIGATIDVSYLRDDPSVSLPVTELEDQSGFHVGRSLFFGACFATFGLIGPFRLRRWMFNYASGRIDRRLSEVRDGSEPAVYYTAEREDELLPEMPSERPASQRASSASRAAPPSRAAFGRRN